VPETGVEPCINVKVLVFSVEGFIGSVKNTPTFVLIGTLVAPFALTVNVTTGVSITGIGIAIVVVVVGVVTCVVTCVVAVVVGVVVVVFGTQADTIIMASTMITDTANESSFFLFIYVPPYVFKLMFKILSFGLLCSSSEAIIKLLV
jgi:hypothetical protein